MPCGYGTNRDEKYSRIFCIFQADNLLLKSRLKNRRKLSDSAPFGKRISARRFPGICQKNAEIQIGKSRFCQNDAAGSECPRDNLLRHNIRNQWDQVVLPRPRPIDSRENKPAKRLSTPRFFTLYDVVLSSARGGRLFAQGGGLFFSAAKILLKAISFRPARRPCSFTPKGRSPSFFLSEFLSSFLEHAVRRRAFAFIPKEGATPKHRADIFFKWKALLPFYIIFYTVQKFCRTPLFVPRAAYTAVSSLRTFPKEKRAIFP